MPTVLLLLVGGLALAAPPPTVLVRPLPAVERPPLPTSFTKAELIAAAGVTTTVAHQQLTASGLADGKLASSPASFSCAVTQGILTVSYVREGFVTEGLPAMGACGEGDGAFLFRIEVVPPGQGT